MTTRDPRHRARRYDGALRRQQFARWLIGGVRALAVPTVLLSLLFAADVVLPGTAETAIAYRRAIDDRWVGPDGYSVAVGWPDRPDCVERRAGSEQRLLFTTRPGCSGRVNVSASFGRQLLGGDTVRVSRTPLFERVRAVRRPADGLQDRWYPLSDIGLYVVLGLVPLLSFGRKFAVYSTVEGHPRHHVVYVLPALAAEALYVWLLGQALGSG
jgi:hypothetical protein